MKGFSVKRTILTGFAFFLICAFWQAYDNAMPLIMINKYGMSQTWSGVIMALDNVFALFLLPLFGALSDKTNTRFGRRKPYIVIGTICAVVFFILLPLIDRLWVFIFVLLLTLLSMSVFRSPAVALMPDVTCKPHRSKGNAIINLMGTAGGMAVLVLGMIFKTGEEGKTDFFAYILATAGLMLLALIVFVLFVREKEWSAEMQENTAKYYPDEEQNERESVGGKLTKSQLVSLMLILSSVALWYMGYNAVTSKYSVYAGEVLNQNYNVTMLIAQGAAIISYFPVGLLASAIGRKKSILIGVGMLFTAFLCAAFMRAGSPVIVMYILFALAGVGWATINVNSFPMVVELAKGSDVGRYTGYYYTASMAAQTLTPVLSGALMDIAGNMLPLFFYASVMVGGSFLTMLFVRHGDAKPPKAKSRLEAFADND
ncbi:MAG: MFS transporter [Candidatus Neoclostridium sp.]